MPANTPENWAKARFLWETDPKVTMRDVAKTLDVAVPTVSVRAKREGWVRVESVALDQLDLTPTVIAEQAIYRLYRLAQDSRDENIVLKASMALLDRTMGKVVEPPPLPPGELPDTPELPQWMDPNTRLAYQHSSSTMPEGLEGPEAPRSTLPPTPAQIAPPSPDSGPPRAPSDPPRHLQAVPKATPNWWDRPGVAATGPVREPDGRA